MLFVQLAIRKKSLVMQVFRRIASCVTGAASSGHVLAGYGIPDPFLLRRSIDPAQFSHAAHRCFNVQPTGVLMCKQIFRGFRLYYATWSVRAIPT